jgi:predicted Zn-dependent peptidase
VVYDVGVRSETPGRTGFAHLFEHLMFQGSVGLERAAHPREVEGAGGTFTGSTHLDFTQYGEAAPSDALELMLHLEADRMRGLRLTEESLTNQVSVVKEEVTGRVLSRPYGGFPWPRLAPILYSRFANTHDGYGAFADLEAATVADAKGFFARYYATGNAVLCVCGDFDPEQVGPMVERHFGDVPRRPPPEAASLDEPDVAGERRACGRVAAPLPALAWAWRVPDPIFDFPLFLPYLLVAELLGTPDAGRLVRRLVFRDRTATRVTGRVGFLGEPFGVRDPTALVFQARLPQDGDGWQVLSAAYEEIERLASGGPDAAELVGARARVLSTLLRETDSVLGRALRMAVFELQRGDPLLLGELPERLASVTAQHVRDAAARLTPDRCVSIGLVPRGSRV